MYYCVYFGTNQNGLPVLAALHKKQIYLCWPVVRLMIKGKKELKIIRASDFKGVAPVRANCRFVLMSDAIECIRRYPNITSDLPKRAENIGHFLSVALSQTNLDCELPREILEKLSKIKLNFTPKKSELSIINNIAFTSILGLPVPIVYREGNSYLSLDVVTALLNQNMRLVPPNFVNITTGAPFEIKSTIILDLSKDLGPIFDRVVFWHTSEVLTFLSQNHYCVSGSNVNQRLTDPKIRQLIVYASAKLFCELTVPTNISDKPVYTWSQIDDSYTKQKYLNILSQIDDNIAELQNMRKIMLTKLELFQ